MTTFLHISPAYFLANDGQFDSRDRHLRAGAGSDEFALAGGKTWRTDHPGGSAGLPFPHLRYSVNGYTVMATIGSGSIGRYQDASFHASVQDVTFGETISGAPAQCKFQAGSNRITIDQAAKRVFDTDHKLFVITDTITTSGLSVPTRTSLPQMDYNATHNVGTANAEADLVIGMMRITNYFGASNINVPEDAWFNVGGSYIHGTIAFAIYSSVVGQTSMHFFIDHSDLVGGRPRVKITVNQRLFKSVSLPQNYTVSGYDFQCRLLCGAFV